MSEVTIYHNPGCSKSRQTLELLREKNVTPEIILYLESPPDEAKLKDLLRLLDFKARDLLRTSEQAYKDLNLSDQNLSDDDLVKAMVTTPKLMQRPIVVANGKAAMGRPPKQVLSIL